MSKTGYTEAAHPSPCIVPPITISHANNHIAYRADIDGLRAVAVLSVIVFHAFPNILPGGFVGVDIFFVISGFLITSIIYKNITTQKFDLKDFYIKRIKRIFPALLLVLGFCLAFGYIALTAQEFKQLGKHIFGASTFISNLILWSEVNYFDNSANSKPLLHLWSLGIEEQYYPLWPIIILCIVNKKLKLITFCIFCLIGSLSLCALINSSSSTAAFYSPPTRFWELLFGSLLAFIAANKSTPKTRAADSEVKYFHACSIAGLLLLIIGFYTIKKSDGFSTAMAFLPVIGSTLIIASGPKAIVNSHLLTNRVTIGIGLISFPLYLWHWPLLSFAHIIEGETPSVEIRLILITISFILAWLTYYFIEQKIRFNLNSRKIVVLLLAMMFFTGFIGALIFKLDGIPQRPNAQISGLQGDIGHGDFHKYIASKYTVCNPTVIKNSALKWENYIRCMQSRSEGPADIALVGDSHAEHLFIGLAEALPEKNIVFYIKDGLPFVGNNDFKDIYNEIATNDSIKNVILSAAWYGRLSQINPTTSLEVELKNSIFLFKNEGKKVYVTDDIPYYNFPPEQCKGTRWLSSKQSNCQIDRAVIDDQVNHYLPQIQDAAKNTGATFVSITHYLCNERYCSMQRDNNLLYRDSAHLNINGSLYLGKILAEKIKPLLN